MTKDLKPHTAIVTIQYVNESRTRGTWSHPDGRRRFVIGAAKTEGDSLGERLISLTTLDAWRASLADQARQQGFTVEITYRHTRYFDADLLHIARIETPEVVR